MGQTLVEKIISNHAGKAVKAGELVIANVDVCAVQDGTGPLTVQEFKNWEKTNLIIQKEQFYLLTMLHQARKKNYLTCIQHYAALQKNTVQYYLKLVPEFAIKDWLKLL